ncbi:efflux RND transporter permease subunit [Candidatus Peregrinibacteria bacterium]|nr:efflux RND transporter permease subunit [Candidatus Peregrinibacteria bacterium]
MNKKFIQKRIDCIKNSPWSFFIKRWRLTLIALVAITMAGLIGLTSMPLESDPEVKIPIGMVTTIFPGASPSDVEKLVTDKLETELKTLDDLKMITSSSSEGVSSITVEFEAEADLTESIRNLRDKADEARTDLPDEAEDPMVTEIRTNDYPVITFSLLGNLTPHEFKQFGDDLKEELEGIHGVSKATLSGIEEKEMQVLIDIKALEGFKLSLSQVVQAIQSNHVDFPIGNILTQDFYYQLSLKGQLETEEELLNLPIANVSGRNIYLKDIADVRDVFGSRTTITKVYQAETERFTSSVTLQVFKKTGASIIDITNVAKQTVEQYRKDHLPPSMDVLVSGDNSAFIREDLRTLGFSGLQVITVIFILLLIALGLKEALLAALSIPFIFFISFIVLFLTGETFNFLVLFALILSIGLIVDNAIIMMEGVHENLKERKLPANESAYLAIATYKTPLISSTLTTVSAFVPMALMPGIMGQYMAHIPRTVTVTLFASLFVATLLLPSMAAHLFRKFKSEDVKAPLLSRFMDPLQDWYEKYILSVLSSKRKRRTWVIGMVIASLIAVSFPVIGIMKIQMFPKWDGDYFTVEIEGALGSRLEDTMAVTEKLDPYLLELPEVDNYVTIVGGGALAVTKEGPAMGLGGATGFNRASVTVNLIEKKYRHYKAYEISEMFREKIRHITEADIVVSDLQTGPPTGADVETRIMGDDLAALERYASLVEKELAQIDGTRDVDTDISHGTGEFHFTVNREQLEFYGLSVFQLASELRTAVFGSNSIKIVKSGDEIPIIVRLDFRDDACREDAYTQLLEKRDDLTLCNLNAKNIDQIKRLLITTPKGQIPLSELVEINLKPTVTTIRHRDAEKVVNVKAFTREGYLAEDIRKTLAVRLQDLPVPEGVHFEFGGEFEEMTESFNSLFSAMYIGLILIAFILVLQFNSFRQPFIILFTLPLALIGVFFGLAAVGRNFSFPGFIGVVALMGVVVNDAIVLIDRINNNIRSGMKKLDAIVRSGKERLQPIFLTTITTATGVLPLVWAGTFWVDLALAIFFGIIFATLLTLVMVPIFYNALETGAELEEVKEYECEYD